MTENRIIEIDWDNYAEVITLLKSCQKRRDQLRAQTGYQAVIFNGKEKNIKKYSHILDHIFDCDINDIFQQETLSQDKKFYVYAHCDPRHPLIAKSFDIKDIFLLTKFPFLKFKPFYIGKGTDDRFIDFNRTGVHRKIRTEITKIGKEIIPIKLAENLTEIEALSLESKLIDLLGLISLSKNGQLANLDEGINSKERRRKYTDPGVPGFLKENGFNVVYSQEPRTMTIKKLQNIAKSVFLRYKNDFNYFRTTAYFATTSDYHIKAIYEGGDISILSETFKNVQIITEQRSYDVAEKIRIGDKIKYRFDKNPNTSFDTCPPPSNN